MGLSRKHSGALLDISDSDGHVVGRIDFGVVLFQVQGVARRTEEEEARLACNCNHVLTGHLRLSCIQRNDGNGLGGGYYIARWLEHFTQSSHR